MKPFAFIGEKTVYADDAVEHSWAEFRELDFDSYVIENWDTTSSKSKAEQQEELVRSWFALGSQGRLKYQRDDYEVPEIPHGVPEDLQTRYQRTVLVDTRTRMFWVRTWFGNDEVTREEADTAYAKLCKVVDADGSQFIDGNWAFEDDLLLADAVGAPTTTGVTPPYVFELLKRYPDIIYGPRDEAGVRRVESGAAVGEQRLLFLVADRRACTEGAVLLFGVDDFGEMMKGRLRIRADDVILYTANWDDGQPIAENLMDGQVGEIDVFVGDAWSNAL